MRGLRALRALYRNTDRATEVAAMGNPFDTMSESIAGRQVTERMTVALRPLDTSHVGGHEVRCSAFLRGRSVLS
ncbi:hypothetical protein TZ00_01750 [Agreia bicolorata]|uniref:Uncharacterized protein n=1 Tax=Agreia bicolorata TaxID=110935 RepID=A0ABR5CIV8_9MICO|nr:hypothetical protein TZ00_01750 [Agreia bicolorata]